MQHDAYTNYITYNTIQNSIQSLSTILKNTTIFEYTELHTDFNC